ncbi:MAG: signal recognition particle protein [Proteobacteria bacterium]|nr:signal recognition particle protein [Pseudomonadota bacterium]
MLDVLSDGFKVARDKFSGKATLSEENVKDAIQEIRKSLLEADVEYGVAKDFIARVEAKALGQRVDLKAGAGGNRMRVTAADHFVKICHDELVDLMGESDSSLKFASNRPTIIMMVGLQGSGKTTTSGKLCKYLTTKLHKKPLLVAADIYRPAAVDQLRVLGKQLQIPVFHLAGASPVDICKAALLQALELGRDTIVMDTAGRLTIDSELMIELDDIKRAANPDNIIFVCDAMMGQDAVTTAKAFNDRLDISGVVMTKLDGDARGGAALSIRRITGKPIKFLGMGESLDRLDEFRPEGLASRILGMGDVVGLMEDFDRVHEGDKEADMLKMLEGQFNFKDFYEQLSMIQKMGSLKDIMAKLPMQNMIPKDAKVEDGELVKIKAMIDSMTEKERVKPSLFNESRVRRIAKGSGTKAAEVMDLIKRFKAMRNMMGMMGKGMGGLLGKIPGMGGLNQMNQMRKMAQGMMGSKGGGGGMGGAPSGMPDFGRMFGGESANIPAKVVDREKLKKLRKQAKDARKKNRR